MQRPGQRHAPLSRVLGERDGQGSDPAKRVYDQKSVRADAPKPEKPPISLRKKPTEKLSLNFNPDEKKDELKRVSPKASEDLKHATKDVSTSIEKKETKKPVLRASRPDPNL